MSAANPRPSAVIAADEASGTGVRPAGVAVVAKSVDQAAGTLALAEPGSVGEKPPCALAMLYVKNESTVPPGHGERRTFPVT